MSYAKELHTTIEFKHHSAELMAQCPDEDYDMLIDVKDESGESTSYCLDLDEAQELGEFLIEHVKNARKQQAY